MKTIISKSKKDKVETLLYAGFGAIAMVVAMEGKVDDKAIKIRDRCIKEIMALLK